MNIFNIKNIALVALTALLFSCVKEDGFAPLEEKINPTITLSINDPGDVNVDVKSVATTEERTFSDMYVLIFDGSTGKYKEGASIDVLTKLTNNGDFSQTLTLPMTPISGDNIVVLGNTKINGLAALTVGTSTKADINKAFPSTNWTGPFAGESGTLAIPMSGEFTFGASTVCEMVRSMAKIEIVYDSALSGKDVTGKFKRDNLEAGFGVYNALKSTFGCVYATKGTTSCVLPDNITASSFGSITYTSATGGLPEGACIYVPEYTTSTRAMVKTVGDTDVDTLRTWVGIKVAANQFYRLDLVNQTTGKYFNIQRNKHYRIIIKSVKASGYPTLEDAAGNPGSNIDYEVKTVGPEDQISISNGQYAIALEYDNLKSYVADFDTLTLRAHYVLGEGNDLAPKLNKVTGTNDVTIVGSEKLQADENSVIKFTIGGRTNEQLYGKIIIQFGNLTKEINVNRQGFPLDAHYDNKTYTGSPFGSIEWRSVDNGLSFKLNSATSITLVGRENVTPAYWKLRGVLVADGSDPVSEPFFENRYAYGYINTDFSITKYIFSQLSPIYYGWFGGAPDQLSATYYSKRAVTERIGQTADTWSMNGALGLPDRKDGVSNCASYMASATPTNYKAAYRCYMLNDVNGDGTISADEKINWYLPASNQLIGMSDAFYKPYDISGINYGIAGCLGYYFGQNHSSSMSSEQTSSYMYGSLGSLTFDQTVTGSSSQTHCSRDL